VQSIDGSEIEDDRSSVVRRLLAAVHHWRRTTVPVVVGLTDAARTTLTGAYEARLPDAPRSFVSVHRFPPPRHCIWRVADGRAECGETAIVIRLPKITCVLTDQTLAISGTEGGSRAKCGAMRRHGGSKP